MSIFGNLDTTEIGDNPFYTKPDTYWALCTDAVQKVSEDGTQTQLVITWTIDEPDNEYHGNNVQEYYSLFPEYEGDWSRYSPDEKKATKFLLSRLRRGFDLSESEMQTVEYSQLIGKGAFITLKESKGKEGTKNAGKTFVNVFNALSKRLYEEEKGSSNSVSNTLGL
jgi:hypothetical protein